MNVSAALVLTVSGGALGVNFHISCLPDSIWLHGYRQTFIQLPALTDQVIGYDVNQLAGVYETESSAEFLSLPYERFGCLKERNDQN